MKIETQPDSQKQTQILKLLQFGTVMVFVDSRRKEVMVPDHLKDDYQLRLNFDYAYEVDDFRILTDRMEASLSFNHKDFFCVIPLEAVYLVVNHSIKHGVLFTQSVPVEMLEYFAAEAQREEEKLKGKKHTHGLCVINNEGKDTGSAGASVKKAVGSSGEGGKSAPRKRGHLRVVK
ncbi:MAG: hypothetical protein HQM16_03480 [Deltaproteobacteria bacterium]|nr:hypothetical protein [Deltaproteobacteria bacterium]